jgi:hypothetical protein
MIDQNINHLIDILGNEIKPGDICVFSVRGWGMEAGVFIKETPKKLSFRVPCWWCVDKEQFSVSSINKNNQYQKVLVLKNPLFYLDVEKMASLVNIRDVLINKGILKEDCNNEQSHTGSKEN